LKRKTDILKKCLSHFNKAFW